ncbi:IQ domain-containing protein N [Uranotaenia lowii]|uniref:IQ domain-containing protein N n=1 Tax=Uranotaenia lowii TaxID=190385 RepID=UPI0024790070|nr:IQ domain-containing protein N [Uranotaenia lowii]
MHIHPSSPNSCSSSQSEDDAATKIQAGFRGYRVRKQMRGQGSSSGSQGSQRGTRSLEEKSAAKIQAGVRGFLVRKRQKVANDAATKIQASFRGFKTRKDLNKTPSKKEK